MAQKYKQYPDIEPQPRTQQEIDDYGPDGIDLLKFKYRPYKLTPVEHPFLTPLRKDE